MQIKIASLFLLLTTVSAIPSPWHKYSELEYSVMSCKAAVEASGTFCGKKLTKGYKCACKVKPDLGSWINCVYDKHGINNTKAEDIMVEYCNEANVTITEEKIRAAYVNATHYIKNVTEIKGYNKTKTINYPITGGTIDKKYKANMISYKHRYGNFDTSHYLGISLLAAWGGLMVICGLCNWIQVLLPGFTAAVVGVIPNSWRKHVTLPALFGRRHIESFGSVGLFPDRFEFIILTLTFIYVFLGTAILGFTYFYGDPNFPTKGNGVSRYIGDRSAILCSYMFPLLFMLPGRNNLLQWLTRWHYSRFVVFHKGLARITVLEVFVHSVAMSVQSMQSDKWSTRLAADWYRYGIVATVCCCLATGLAGFTIRRYWYEMFLVTHIVLITMFLWTAWLHAKSQDYHQYYIACVSIWCFDRFIRIVRIAMFGVRTAKCEVLSEEGTIKLTVPYPKSYWKASPAAHGFVHFLTPRTFWQSHPFTLIESVTDKNHIHFYCKIKGGVTKLIGGHVTDKNKFDVKVLVEGPYGNKSPYQRYDKAVLIAGGNGIPGPFSHALDLVSKGAKTEVKLYWAIREYNALNWFKEELTQFKGTSCKPIVYVSNVNSSILNVDFEISSGSSDNNSTEEKVSSTDEKNGEPSIEQLKQTFDFIEIRQGRMNVDAIIAEEINESNGTIAFGACAHPNMTDSVRAAVTKSLNKYNKRIDYFEEMQSW